MVVIVSSMEGAAVLGGISALGGALASIGILVNSTAQYEDELKIGKLILIVRGKHEKVERAKHDLDATTSTVTTLHSVAVSVSA